MVDGDMAAPEPEPREMVKGQMRMPDPPAPEPQEEIRTRGDIASPAELHGK